MSTPTPPHLSGARAQLEAVLEAVEKRKIDLATTSWADIEKSVIKVLGGPFRPNEQQHQLVALGLAAVLGERLATELNAFWFVSRESPEGVAIGFPDALVMLSPFGAVLESLAMSSLPRLEDVTKEIRNALAQAKFSGQGAARLGPQDYQTLFDPGYLQLLAIDPAKVEAALKLPPDRLALDLREALSRAQLPDQAKKQVETQLISSLGRLERGKPMIDQVAKAPRLAELVTHLFGATAQSGSAPEELWSDVAIPLMFIGAPEKFPEIDGDELALAKKGIDPFVLFIEVCPFATPAPEDGLLGAFPADQLDLPHPALAAVGQPRVVKVSVDAVKGPLEKFDPAKTKDAVERFAKHVEAKAGPPPTPITGRSQATEMLDASLSILADFKAIAASGKMVCLRRLTEAEAMSDGALAVVRKALSGPRIILA
jgi:hypothetical protein